MWMIDEILTGKIARFADDGQMSAIVKAPASGPRGVGFLGIDDDEQADLSVHGGPDKAIHHYPYDHYPWWAAQLPTNAPLDHAGAFGENVSTRRLTENDVCLGDRFRLGTALVEVCQGRQPCWKQARRLNDKRVVSMMVKSGYTGWYYRVLEEGRVAAGDALIRVAHPHPEWSVARVTGIVIAGRERDPATVSALRDIPALAEGWRVRL